VSASFTKGEKGGKQEAVSAIFRATV